MFMVSVGFSLIVIAVTYRTARKDAFETPLVAFITGLAAVFLSVIVLLPAVIVQALSQWLFAIALRIVGGTHRRYLTLSFIAFLLIQLGSLAYVYSKTSYIFELQKEYPYESIEDRLPLVSDTEEVIYKPKNDTTRLYPPIGMRMDQRERQLKRLHEDTLSTFLNNPGFGIMRAMAPGFPTAEDLKKGLDKGLTPVQVDLQSSQYREKPMGLTLNFENMLKLHQFGVDDFVYAEAFGYVKDRKHVAGFESHRFGYPPQTKEYLAVRVELVSLIMHPKPVVYISDKLPQMDVLKTAPTRPLETWEAKGLEMLQKGEDLFIQEDKVLGSIRNETSCIKCHGGQNHQLLGAFSYTIRKWEK